MLKKASIVVAAAAAGLLAVSPLAFAGEAGAHGHDKGHGHGHHSKSHDHGTEAASAPTYDHSPSCDFDAENNNGVSQGALGYEALFGLAGLATNGAAPANAQAQAPVLSCNNISDIGNVTTTTRTVNQNDETTIDRSVTDGSFNSLGLLG